MKLVNSPQRSLVFYAAILVIALGAFVLVFTSTTSGVSTSPDSWNYLATSRNLLAGNGFYISETKAFTQWTPLYPSLLAVVYGMSDVTNTDVHILRFLRWSNALTFSATVLICAFFFQKQIRSRTLLVIALLWILVSLPILTISTYAWSDLLLVPLSILFMFYLTKMLENPEPGTLAALIILAGLAALERHAGIILTGVGAVSMVLWMSATPLRRRLWYAGLFGVGASAPFALWLARCYLVSNQLAGSRGEPIRSLRTNIRQIVETMMHWFIPRDLGIGYLKFTGVVIVVFALVFALQYRRHGKLTLGGLERKPGVLPMVLLILGHSIFLISSATLTRVKLIDDRYLAPSYPFVILLVFIVIEQLQEGLSRRFQNPAVRYVLPVIAILGLWVPIDRLNTAVPTLQGISKYSNQTYDTWRASDLVRQLKAHPPSGRTYSNAPLYVLVQTGIASRAVPGSLDGWASLGEDLPRSQPDYLLWFEKPYNCDYRNYCVKTSYQINDLKTFFEVQEDLLAADGAVYRLISAPDN